MPDAIELLQRIIADSKRGSEIPNIAELTDDDYIFVFVPGSGFRKVKKGDIVFPGEPISKLTELSDTPSQTLGQAGKILIVNETEDGFVYRAINDVEGVTQQELNDALANYIKTISVNGGSAQSPDENGNVNLTVSTESGSFEGYQIIDLGDILTATIQDEFNDDALASPIVIDKGTIIKAIQNDEAKQWFFVGTPATYDGSATLAVASDFYSFVSRAEMEAAIAEINTGGGSGIEILEPGAFNGTIDLSDGNYRFYNLYDSGSALGLLQISSTKKVGSQAILEVKGDLITDVNNFIPNNWRSTGQPITGNPLKINELRTELLKSNLVAIHNRVFDYVDETEPTAPTNLSSPTKTDTSIDLTWEASSDNVGVVVYNMKAVKVSDSSEITATSNNTSGSISNLEPETDYSITVTAEDAAGNISGESNVLLITTAASAGFEPEYQAMLDYADANGFVKPSAAQQTIDNQKVSNLKTEGVWSKIPFLWNGKAAYTPTSFDTNFYRLNWKNPGVKTLQANSVGEQPDFITGQGWKSPGGSGKFFLTDFIPADDSGAMTQTNSSVIFKIFDSPTTYSGENYFFGGRMSGSDVSQTLVGNNTASKLLVRFNDYLSGVTLSIDQSQVNSHYQISSGATIKVFINGTDTGVSYGNNTDALTSAELHLFGFNTNGVHSNNGQDLGISYFMLAELLQGKESVVYQIMNETY